MMFGSRLKQRIIIPALAGFQRRYAVGEKEHVSDCLLLLPDSTLGQKARDLEVPEVFHKFKPLLLMFLMAKKYGTPRGTKILKICIWNASCPSWDKNLIWTQVSGFLVRGRCILRWIELVWGVHKVCGVRDATIWWWKLSARWKSECLTLQVWEES